MQNMINDDKQINLVSVFIIQNAFGKAFVDETSRGESLFLYGFVHEWSTSKTGSFPFNNDQPIG